MCSKTFILQKINLFDVEDKMKILIVEDDIQKAQEVMKFVEDNGHKYKHIVASSELKNEIKNSKYDIIIVDIVIPDRPSEPKNENGGLYAIQHIMETTDNIFRPKTIIALTKYYSTEILKTINKYGVCCIEYDEVSEKWKNELDNCINYVITANTKKADIAMITAVDVEFEALKSIAEWEAITINDDNNEYYWTTLVNECGNEVSIVMAQSKHMGLVSATNLTTRISRIFDPSCIIMTGIAGGRKGKVNLGDIVVAVEAWDYSSGSIEDSIKKKNEIIFLPNPYFREINDDLRKVFSKYSNDEKLLFELRKKCNLPKFNQDIKMHLGCMASGPAVIKSAYFVEKFIHSHHRNFLSIDMEIFGVYYAASLMKPSKLFVSIKAVSDVADQDKDDEYQKYGSLLTANLALHYIKTDYIKTEYI